MLKEKRGDKFEMINQRISNRGLHNGGGGCGGLQLQTVKWEKRLFFFINLSVITIAEIFFFRSKLL